MMLQLRNIPKEFLGKEIALDIHLLVGDDLGTEQMLEHKGHIENLSQI